jgi:zinc protease
MPSRLPLLVLSLLALPGAASALSIPTETVVLGNGLTVILSPDARVPTVGVSLLYRVGSRDEAPSEEGFAHLFEHMMFQGSAHVGKMEHFSLLADHGGDANGSTSKDFTFYYEEVPANQLPLALWLEADRMRSLAVDQENLRNQKDVVIEEMRQSYENRPYGQARLELPRLAYTDRAYSHPTIGNQQALEAASLDMVRAFHARWYGSANAILALSGDFDRDAALAWVTALFGDLPVGTPPARAAVHEDPTASPRSGTLQDPRANLPALFLAWQAPPLDAPDRYAVEVLARILGQGKSSRLYQALVKQARVAVQVAADLEGLTGPDLLSITALHPPGKAAALSDEITRVLHEVRANGVTAEEVARVVRQVESEYTYSLASNLHRAMLLSMYAFWFGDPGRVNREVENYARVTPAQVQEAARRYLDPGLATRLQVEVAR